MIAESMPQLSDTWRQTLLVVEIIVIIGFTLEYAARLWSAPETNLYAEMPEKAEELKAVLEELIAQSEARALPSEANPMDESTLEEVSTPLRSLQELCRKLFTLAVHNVPGNSHANNAMSMDIDQGPSGSLN